MEEVLSNLDFL